MRTLLLLHKVSTLATSQSIKHPGGLDRHFNGKIVPAASSQLWLFLKPRRYLIGRHWHSAGCTGSDRHSLNGPGVRKSNHDALVELTGIISR